jgi:hypothetical protein
MLRRRKRFWRRIGFRRFSTFLEAVKRKSNFQRNRDFKSVSSCLSDIINRCYFLEKFLPKLSDSSLTSILCSFTYWKIASKSFSLTHCLCFSLSVIFSYLSTLLHKPTTIIWNGFLNIVSILSYFWLCCQIKKFQHFSLFFDAWQFRWLFASNRYAWLQCRFENKPNLT